MIELLIIIFFVAFTIRRAARKNQQQRPAPPFASPGKARPSSGQTGNKKTASTVQKQENSPSGTRSFIEPTKPYRPAHNAGGRYEEWMPVPEGKRVCRCGYCGADNLIPKGSDPKNYTCYFCREEL